MTNPNWLWVAPDRPCGTGVLLVAGSSGRIDQGRAELLARHGALVLAVRWFGGPGQPEHPAEVPLETFTAALDALRGRLASAAGKNRLAMIGLSYGAEAALLTGVRYPFLDATVAFAPTHVVWEGASEPAHPRSKWTWQADPLPYVPFDNAWAPDTDPPAYAPGYAHSVQLAGTDHPETLVAATIPVERITGRVILVAGGDDQVWPSLEWSRAIATRRAAYGLDTTVITDPQAGHRIPLPGEPTAVGGQLMARGGTPSADARLGAAAWPVLAEALALHP